MPFPIHTDYYGNSGIIVRDMGKLRSDRTRLQTCTAVFSVPAASYLLLPNIGARHPVFDQLNMERRELDIKGPFAVASCEYAGFELEIDLTPPVYEVSNSLVESPISTHPDFEAFAGTPMIPLNGANFSKTGASDANAASPAASAAGYEFSHFDTFHGGALNPYAKITDYLEAGQFTYRKIQNMRDYSAVLMAGRIDTPTGPVPQLAEGATWLNMGFSSTQRGSVYQVTIEWRASGRRGWNTTIYG